MVTYNTVFGEMNAARVVGSDLGGFWLHDGQGKACYVNDPTMVAQIRQDFPNVPYAEPAAQQPAQQTPAYQYQGMQAMIPQTPARQRHLIENNRGSYTGLATQVVEMGNIANEIQAYLISEQSIGNKVLYKAKSWARKLMGKEQYTLEELFDAQLDNIKGLNRNLGNILVHSRNELEQLCGYSDNVSVNYSTHMNERQEKKGSIDSKVQQYKNLQEQTKGKTKADPQYMKAMLDMRRLEREIDEEKHSYLMNNDAIVDFNQEDDFLYQMEAMLRTSVHTSERLLQKTQRIETHVEQTKKAYTQLQNQQVCVSSLYTAIELLNQYSIQVHSILGEGLKAMVHATNNSDSLNNFHVPSSERLSAMLEDIKSANKVRDEARDKVIDAYITS